MTIECAGPGHASLIKTIIGGAQIIDLMLVGLLCHLGECTYDRGRIVHIISPNHTSDLADGTYHLGELHI